MSLLPTAIAFRCPIDGLPELGEKVLDRSCSPGADVLITFPNLFLHLGVSRVKIVLQLVHIHESRDGDTVSFENEIFLVDVNAFDHRAKVMTGLGQRYPMDRCRAVFSQCKLPMFKVI